MASDDLLRKIPGGSAENEPLIQPKPIESVKVEGRKYSIRLSETELSKTGDTAKAIDNMKNGLLTQSNQLKIEEDKLERKINNASTFERVISKIFGDSDTARLKEVKSTIKNIAAQILRLAPERGAQVEIQLTKTEKEYGATVVGAEFGRADDQYGKTRRDFRDVFFKNNVYKSAQNLITFADKSPDIAIKHENYRKAFAILDVLKNHADFKPNSMEFINKLESGIKDRISELPPPQPNGETPNNSDRNKNP